MVEHLFNDVFCLMLSYFDHKFIGFVNTFIAVMIASECCFIRRSKYIELRNYIAIISDIHLKWPKYLNAWENNTFILPENQT